MSTARTTTPGSALLALAVEDRRRSRDAYDRLLGPSAGDTWDVGNGRIVVSDHAPATAHRALFCTSDYEATTRLLQRRGLPLREVGRGTAEALDPPSVGIVADSQLTLTPPESEITSIDHLVFNASNRDEAVALFGATLGLDFRLEQSIHDGIHQLFFRSSTVVVEVVVGAPGQPAASGAVLWGIAWRSDDIEHTHRRLTADGMSLSEIRVGRKPGTNVFTLRDPAFGLPTLVLG